jgi:signal transduction histidine kinase
MSSAAERWQSALCAAVRFIEGTKCEQALAISRLLISLISLAALWSLVWSYGAVARLIPLLYVLHSLVILVRVFVARPLPACFPTFVHAFDLMWAALIFLLTGHSVLLFVFVLVAVSYRWEARETLLTAVGSILILALEARFVSLPLGAGLRFLDDPVRRHTLVLQVLGLLVLGGLLAYITDREQRLKGSAAAADSILQHMHPEAGIRKNLKNVLRGFLEVFAAKGIVLILRHSSTGRAFGLRARRDSAGQPQRRRISSSEADRYLPPAPGQSWSMTNSNASAECNALVRDRDRRRFGQALCPIPPGGLWNEPFRTLSVVDVRFGGEWTCRAFLIDARWPTGRASCLRSFQQSLAAVVPAMYNSYLWWRMRGRARLIERECIARDLHDGVVQALIALEMNIDLLRRQSGRGFDAAETVASAQRLIRREIRNVRGMIEQLRSDAPPRPLLASLTETVEAFQRETGIAASLACHVQDGLVSPRVSQEVAQIVREALCNVRKHSGARKVEVCLASNHDTWQVVIQDDGRGFDFTGRLSDADLQAGQKGPRVIRERVHCVNGDLAIESYPDRGARLEISLVPNG